MRKLIIMIMCILLILGLCACNNTEEVPEETLSIGEKYSVGLTEDGYYIDYEELAPEYTYDLTVTEEDLIASITSLLETEMGSEVTFDYYLELYANDFLSAMELDRKDVVEMTDAVVVSLNFTDKDGEAMTEYTQESQRYVVQEDSDSIISSFLTHKVGDQYTVEYTFPEDDEYHPSETVTVEVLIEDIYYSDAVNSGVVEAHLTELNEVLVGVEDAATLKAALRPYVLGYHLQDYIEEIVMASDIPVPDEWIEYEQQRLTYRLEALSMTRDQYKEQLSLSEEDIAKSCELIVRENMVAMSEYSKLFDTGITDDDLSTAHGEDNLAYYASLQGYPYLRLRLMRSLVYGELAKNTPVLDADGNPIDLSLYFGVEEETIEENTESVEDVTEVSMEASAETENAEEATTPTN